MEVGEKVTSFDAELWLAGFSGEETRGTDDDEESACWRGIERCRGLNGELLGGEDMDLGVRNEISLAKE